MDRRLEKTFLQRRLKMANRHIKSCSTSLIIHFSSVAQSCPTLCNPMNCSTPGLPVHHQLPEFTKTHVHWVSDAIQPSHPLSSPSPPAPNPSQHQSLFRWVNSSHEVAKVLEFQLQHHSFQRNSRKLQWGITSQWSEWPSTRSIQTTNAGKGVEKRKPFYIVGGDVNCCSH